MSGKKMIVIIMGGGFPKKGDLKGGVGLTSVNEGTINKIVKLKIN